MLRCAQHDNGETELVPPIVTLSEAKGLSRCAMRCFAALSMTFGCLGPIKMCLLFGSLLGRLARHWCGCLTRCRCGRLVCLWG
jgi:hypothetical protein